MHQKEIHKKESASLPDRMSVRAFSGFMTSLLLMGGAAVFLLTRKLIPWPFHGADSIADSYGRILVYLPFTGFSFLSVFWIKGNQRSIRDFITWNRFSFTFLAGFVLSAGYSLYLFLSHDFALKGLAFVPPAMMLGLLNAFSEELLFRLVLFQLLIPLTGSWQRANLMQAVLYGFVHLFIGGPVFFLCAVGYGLLLGWITKTNESILPAIICHFVADIGAIGLPLLILY
jgi:membrane protease YdiL (CAAX protease family)